MLRPVFIFAKFLSKSPTSKNINKFYYIYLMETLILFLLIYFILFLIRYIPIALYFTEVSTLLMSADDCATAHAWDLSHDLVTLPSPRLTNRPTRFVRPSEPYRSKPNGESHARSQSPTIGGRLRAPFPLRNSGCTYVQSASTMF